MPILSLCTVLAIIIFGCCISGCKISNASYNAKNNATTPDTTAPMLAWDAPTTYSDGSALLDLKEYRIYYSTSSGPYASENYHTVPAQTTSIKARDLVSQGTGTYYFVVTVVDSTNRESNPSNEVSRYLN